jgi:CHRD domain
MRRKLFVFALIAALSTLAVGSLAAGKTPRPVKFKAALNVGQEKPHPKGTKVGASGHFTATLTGTTLTWKLTWKSLSGPATASHIHLGKKGVNGGILVTLCPPSCTSPLTGMSALTPAIIADMKAQKTYVNVHTARNPNGEIRGQITRAL